MKPLILTTALVFSAFFLQAQSVTELLPGKYESRAKTSQSKWERGDVIILDNNRYKLSSSGDEGEFRLSVAAQRIFFTSGPLKSAFTKVAFNNNKTVIIFPAEQNGDLGLKAEVWASKQ